MKLLVLACLLGTTLAVPTAIQHDAYNYFEKVGIPLAESIRAAEASGSGARVVGGSAATLGQLPYVAGLIITLSTGFTAVCGATLLTNTKLVTAAHCWFDGWNQAQEFEVVLGSLTLFESSDDGSDTTTTGSVTMTTDSVTMTTDTVTATTAGVDTTTIDDTGKDDGVRIKTRQVQPHEYWDPSTAQNDIAIITIQFVAFTDNIKSITLPSGSLLNNDYVGTFGVAAGWGKQSDNSIIANDQVLHRVSLQVVTNALCQSLYGPSVVTATSMCVSGAGGRSTCSGDSGGPLVTSFAGRDVLIGISSFTHNDGCTLGYPTGFTRVTSYINWIINRIYSYS